MDDVFEESGSRQGHPCVFSEQQRGVCNRGEKRKEVETWRQKGHVASGGH